MDDNSIARLPPAMRPRELGRAHGLEQAARVIRAVAADANRVVGTNQLKELAAEFEKIAERIKEKNQ